MSSIAKSIEERIEATLSKKRLRHIRGVETVAHELSIRFGVDRDACQVAALAHDMLREIPQSEMIQRVDALRLVVSDQERRNPSLLHGPLAAWELKATYSVQNAEVVDAVRHHTLGHPDLGPIGWILYVADYIEPGRKHVNHRDRQRILSLQSLPAMVCAVIDHSRRRFDSLESPTLGMYRRLQCEDSENAVS